MLKPKLTSEGERQDLNLKEVSAFFLMPGIKKPQKSVTANGSIIVELN